MALLFNRSGICSRPLVPARRTPRLSRFFWGLVLGALLVALLIVLFILSPVVAIIAALALLVFLILRTLF
jgi:hypothetical protein